MEMRLEALVLPVSDIDRAKAFYEQLGFVCDVDHEAGPMRVVQFTPPGSTCSITFGRGLGAVTASPIMGLHLVVTDLAAAVEQLRGRAVDVADPFHFGAEGQMLGVDPNHADYASYAEFVDPDGNTWTLQEVGFSDGD